MNRESAPRDPRAAAASFDAVPEIDLAPLADPAPPSRQRLAEAIADACERVGFFYVVNHGVAAERVDRVFAAAAAFFARPYAEKMRLDIHQSENFRGYLPIGLAGGTAIGNQKEGFQIQPELPLDDPDVRAGKPLHGPNPWPADLPAFRTTLLDYFAAIEGLANELARLFALGLGLEEAVFLPHFTKPLYQLRLLRYPPQPADEPAIGSQPHTDTGAFTILAQDAVGGLEVAAGPGQWARVRPIEGSFVINIGEMMKLWSDGRFSATPHRVINASPRDRYSVAFFANPNFDTVVTPMMRWERPAERPALVGHLERRKPIRSGDALLSIYSRLWPRRPAAE